MGESTAASDDGGQSSENENKLIESRVAEPDREYKSTLSVLAEVTFVHLLHILTELVLGLSYGSFPSLPMFVSLELAPHKPFPCD